jgi:serine/threonine protein kinase
MQVRCPQCHTLVELASSGKLSEIACPSCGSSFSLLGTDETTAYEHQMRTIGHFRLDEQVGIGSFGSVWRARDTELDRIVAVKIPRKGQLDPGRRSSFFVKPGRQPNCVTQGSSACMKLAASKTLFSS